jgi:hypothetical protein
MKDAKITYDGDKVSLFKDDIYKENNLVKPEVLSLIDYLNEKLHYSIDYNTFTLDDLITKLKEVE